MSVTAVGILVGGSIFLSIYFGQVVVIPVGQAIGHAAKVVAHVTVAGVRAIPHKKKKAKTITTGVPFDANDFDRDRDVYFPDSGIHIEASGEGSGEVRQSERCVSEHSDLCAGSRN